MVAFQADARDLARGPLFIVGELGWVGGMPGVEAVMLLAVGDMRTSRELLLAHLDGHLGVLSEVVVPGGGGWRAALGGDNHVVVSVPGGPDPVLTHTRLLPSFLHNTQPHSAL